MIARVAIESIAGFMTKREPSVSALGSLYGRARLWLSLSAGANGVIWCYLAADVLGLGGTVVSFAYSKIVAATPFSEVAIPPPFPIASTM